MAISDEIKEKERRVRDFLRAKGLKALLLKRQANFSWLTAGGLNLVGITTEVGAASLLITETGKYVITSNIEAPRMAAEENLEALGYEIRSFPWYEEREADLVAEIVGTGALGSDVPFPQAVVLAEEIARLRYSLTADELVRYRWLGERVSAALEKTMVATVRGEKESEVVGRLSNELWKDRIDPVTLMSAADARISRYRHCIPMENRVERLLMVSVNARKGGLIVSLTRFVHFGTIPPECEGALPGERLDRLRLHGGDASGCTRGGGPQERDRGVRRCGVSGGVEAPPPGRFDRVHRQGLPLQLPDPGRGPGESGLHLEPLPHGDEVGGYDPGHEGRAGDDHPADTLPNPRGGGRGDRFREAGYPREGLKMGSQLARHDVSSVWLPE